MPFIKYIDKIKRLDRLIRLRSTGSPAELAKKFNVSERMIYNYLENFKELGAPVKYNKFYKSYVYKNDVTFEIGFKILELETEEYKNIDGGFLKFLNCNYISVCLFTFDKFQT